MQDLPATMAKDKTSALERAKEAAGQGKGKRSPRGGSSSRSALPRGWIQGDWMPSVIRQEDLDDMVEGGSFPMKLRISRGERSNLNLVTVSASSSPPISIADFLYLLILFSGAF